MLVRAFLAFTFVYIASGPSLACAELVSNDSRWKKIADGIEFVDEVWKFPCASNKQLGFVVPETRLTAYRFERRKFEFILIDPAIELQKVDRKRYDIGGAFLNKRKKFMRPGQNIGTVAEFSTISGNFALNVPAGWWQDTNSSQPDGYLKISGKVISEIFTKGQSAVICLDDQSLSTSRTIGNTIAVWFYYNKGRYAYSNWTPRRKERLSECMNVFQTGPRVVEREEDRLELFADSVFSGDPAIQCLTDLLQFESARH